MSDTIVSINPATGEKLGAVPVSTHEDVAAKVRAAHTAQPTWQAMGLDRRIAHLRTLADLLQKNGQALSEITAREMGRPLDSCLSLTSKSIERFLWNLDHAAAFLGPETTYEDAQERTEIVYEPRGVVACIMAWNFPIGNFGYSITQALIAGNTVVAKYSEEIPLFSQTLEKICEQARLPEGVLGFVHGGGETGALLADQDIDIISFTGSSQTGRKLHMKAAEKGIPIVMELGGSSPGIVFADARPDAIADSIFALRFSNCGQVCSSLKRLLVHASLFECVVDSLARIARRHKVGDPLAPDTQMGPLVAERQLVKLEAQVADALAKGACVVCGGKRPADLKGFYYEPTILTGISKDMRVWHEEVFGPVLPVLAFETYEDAIALANDTVYGLTGYAFTADEALAARAARDIKAGCIGLNGANFTQMENPFGGYKQSGLGRENGKWGFHDMCQVKVIAYRRGAA